jgi:hypothetical protein
MSLINISQLDVPLITFNSDEWKKKKVDDGDIAEEIIKYLKDSKAKKILIQNKAYSFGDTEVPSLIMVNSTDFGGFKGTLDTFIKDIIYDLIPED